MTAPFVQQSSDIPVAVVEQLVGLSMAHNLIAGIWTSVAVVEQLIGLSMTHTLTAGIWTMWVLLSL